MFAFHKQQKQKSTNGLHQVQKLWHSKRTNKMKRQPTEWEKIFTNRMSDKGLISKLYKDVTQLNNKNSLF